MTETDKREVILKVKGIEKTYGLEKGNRQQILKGIDMEICRGEFVAVMGPSGSGKTTLLNLISGFVPSDKGTISINGENIAMKDKEQMADMRSELLGFIFQDFMLIDGLTAKENVYLPQIISGKKPDEIEKNTGQLLDFFQIDSAADKYPFELSGGQKQRTAIARALSNQPVLILADEPTGNLDSRSSKAVIDAFVSAREKLGVTILMVTHDAFAASYADRLIAVADGKIVRRLKRETKPDMFMDEILDFLKNVERQEQ